MNRYLKTVEQLRDAIGDGHSEPAKLVRDVIERVTLKPVGPKTKLNWPFEVIITGRLEALVGAPERLKTTITPQVGSNGGSSGQT